MNRRYFLAGAGGLILSSVSLPAWSAVPVSAAIGQRVGGSCKVIGIGGCGCNVVLASRLAMMKGTEPVPEIICVDLGRDVLERVEAANEAAPDYPPIKSMSLAPYGAGGWVNGARAMALRKRDDLRDMLAGADVVFLVAGLGGGTGSGLTPIMALLAREAGALPVAVVVTPFEFESRRKRTANTTISYLNREADLVVTFSNEDWAKTHDDGTPLIDVFTSLDQHIAGYIQGFMDRENQIMGWAWDGTRRQIVGQ